MNHRNLWAVALASLLASAASAQQFVYPAKGQTPEKQKADEAACYSWAVGQTKFDPAKPPPPPPAATPPTTATGTTPGAGARGAGAGRSWARSSAVTPGPAPRRVPSPRGGKAAGRMPRPRLPRSNSSKRAPSNSRPPSPRRAPLAWRARATRSSEGRRGAPVGAALCQQGADLLVLVLPQLRQPALEGAAEGRRPRRSRRRRIRPGSATAARARRRVACRPHRNCQKVGAPAG